MKRLVFSGMLLALLALAGVAQNQRPGLENKPDVPAASAGTMNDWQAMRFGMFIHWGPVSLKGTEIGWSRMEPADRTGYEQRCGIGHKGVIPTEEYDNLYKRFNPVKFNAREWVAVAKAAGMKYMVLTTRHHDGFSEFDSKVSDYKVTNSPFGRDVVKEYADAVHEGGLKLGFYYSQPDWHNPDYMNIKTHKRYIEYMHAQVRELMTNYGKVDILWFDGLGGKATDWEAEKLIKMIRQLQPGIVINNRCGVPQDFDTPEQKVGAFQNTRPWESCMTISAHNHWAWGGDADGVKPLAACIQMLVGCATGDGNMLLNVGPMPTGEIAPCQVDRLKEIGAWMQKNGETIYGTRGGPFLLGRNGGSTHKGNTVYLHVMKWVEDAIALPDPEKKILSASLFGKGSAVEITRSEGNAIVSVPKDLRDALDTIIELKLSGPASEIKPVLVWGSRALSTGKRAKASNIYLKNRNYSAAKAVDGDESSRWATDSSVKQATLEVDLGKAEAIGGFRIIEASYPRVSEFSIEIEKDGKWTPVHEGKKIGKELKVSLKEPVAARKVRLNIKAVSQGGPTIEEFEALAPKKGTKNQ